jgi:hypothetical protein
MVTQTSRSGRRVQIPRRMDELLPRAEQLARSIIKSPQKKTRKRSPTPPPSSHDSDEEATPRASKRSKKPERPPVILEDCVFSFSCSALLDKIKIFSKTKNFRLYDFNIREWDEKSIKKVTSHAQKIGKDFEFESATVHFGANRVAKLQNDIEDPEEWKDVLVMLEQWFMERKSDVSVQYTINYISKRKMLEVVTKEANKLLHQLSQLNAVDVAEPKVHNSGNISG